MNLIGAAFLLGALAGAIGIWMVMSESGGDEHAVSDIWRRQHLYEQGKAAQ